MPAIEELFSQDKHRFCVRHLYSNFKAKHPGKGLKDALWNCATSTYVEDFEEKMAKLKELSKAAYKWLQDKLPFHWSRSHFTTHPKCDMLLNNHSEAFNRFILDAREKPILTMLELIRSKLMNQIMNKRNKMMKFKEDICPKI